MASEEHITIYGLDPNSTLQEQRVEWTMSDGNNGTAIVDITTDELVFETLPAQATSDTKGLISARANGEDDALRFGFEWRKYEDPDLVPSKMVTCPIYDGLIAGTLNNLTAGRYYKYRPYYKSDAGNIYYGDWLAFGTEDAYVYFEPVVHTNQAQAVSETAATLRASVVEGSDAIEEQGFEYWLIDDVNSPSMHRVPQQVETIVSTGSVMSATLTGLLAGTTYGYRSYDKTAKATTYGEELTFTTTGATIVMIGSTGYATYYSSYAVEIPNGIKAYWGQLSDIGDKLILTEITDGVIPAETAVVLSGEVSNYKMKATAATGSVYNDNVLRGVVAATAVSSLNLGAGKLYVLAKTTAGIAAFCQYTGLTLGDHRAYIFIADEAAAPTISIAFGQDATGIDVVETVNSRDTRYFNLSGQRVEHPTKGIYVIHGKKVVMK